MASAFAEFGTRTIEGGFAGLAGSNVALDNQNIVAGGLQGVAALGTNNLLGSTDNTQSLNALRNVA